MSSRHATPPARFAFQGFLLDRGFQIFLTSYPEARACLDYEALKLQPFYAGALVRFAGGWHRVADPVRHPVDALASLLPDNAVGDVADKLRVGLLRCASRRDASAHATLRGAHAAAAQRAEPAHGAVWLPHRAGAERRGAPAAGTPPFLQLALDGGMDGRTGVHPSVIHPSSIRADGWMG